MPRPSKFSERRRQRLIAALSVGGSRRSASKAAGIDPATLRQWLQRGVRGAPGGRWRTFYEDVRAAEAGPPGPVGIPSGDEDEVVTAMRFLERDPAWAPPIPQAEEPSSVINLKWPKEEDE